MKKCIWFDIGHLAQYNFYKKSIINLSKEYTIIITLLNRGRMLDIVRLELKGFESIRIIPTTNYKYTRFSVYWDTNIKRFFSLLKVGLKYRPDLAVSNGYLQGVVATICRLPNLQFGDDPEAKDYHLKRLFADELYYAFYAGKKAKSLNALKEWAYLSPAYFSPNPNILREYGLKEKKYIFFREVIVTSSNYVNQDANIIQSLSTVLELDYDIVLSLEDKSTRKMFPESWKILEEPVNDIHSLIYYSALTVSTGDSMAREAAQLGVPSIYCGDRVMNAINVLKNKGFLLQVSRYELLETIKKVINHEIVFPEQQLVREVLRKEWIDIPKFVDATIKKYLISFLFLLTVPNSIITAFTQ